MVSRITVVSRFNTNPPLSEEPSNRVIAGGPLYAPSEVLQVLMLSNCVSAWTKKCVSDLQNWEFDENDVRSLVQDAIEQQNYRGSEWCEQKPTGPWAACDVYVLSRKEWIETIQKEMYLEYYIKFAIAKTGTVLLLVSCHLTEI